MLTNLACASLVTQIDRLEADRSEFAHLIHAAKLQISNQQGKPTVVCARHVDLVLHARSVVGVSRIMVCMGFGSHQVTLNRMRQMYTE